MSARSRLKKLLKLRQKTTQKSASPSEFRARGTSLDSVLGVPKRDETPQTRIRTANFIRGAGATKVAWPEPPPASWRSKHSEEIRKGEH